MFLLSHEDVLVHWKKIGKTVKIIHNNLKMVKENEEKTKKMNRGEGGCIITENREMKRKRVRERKTISAQEETVESFNCHPPVSIYPLN